MTDNQTACCNRSDTAPGRSAFIENLMLISHRAEGGALEVFGRVFSPTVLPLSWTLPIRWLAVHLPPYILPIVVERRPISTWKGNSFLISLV